MKNLILILFLTFSIAANCQIKQPKNTVLLNYSSYAVAYDTVNKLPAYSIETITRNKLTQKNTVTENVSFKNEPRLNVKVSDFDNTNYVLAPLTPFDDHQYNQLAFDDCYFISNTAPLLEEFKTGIWKKLEDQVRTWSSKYDTLIVITGPNLNMIRKEGKLTVPKQFYKVIFSPKYRCSVGFLLNYNLKQGDIFPYEIDVKTLSKIIGIEFPYIDPVDKQFWN